MCKVGDIIVVRNYKSHGKTINRHSFVVLSTENGQIQGLETIEIITDNLF